MVKPGLNPGLSDPKAHAPSAVPHGQCWTIPLSCAKGPASLSPHLVSGALLPTDRLLTGYSDHWLTPSAGICLSAGAPSYLVLDSHRWLHGWLCQAISLLLGISPALAKPSLPRLLQADQEPFLASSQFPSICRICLWAPDPGQCEAPKKDRKHQDTRDGR